MPSKSLVNPTGVEAGVVDLGSQFVSVQFDPAGSGVILNGQIVKFKATSVGLAGEPVGILTTTTGDFAFIGVAVNAPAGGYTPGQVMQLQTDGVCSVLMDAVNTVEGQLCIQSALTAGAGSNSATATLGKTLGVVLQTQTIASGVLPTLVYLRIM